MSEEWLDGAGTAVYAFSWEYDPVGNRATIAPSTTYTYGAANQLTVRNVTGTLTTYAYDANGNLVVENANGALMTLTWGYEDEMLTANNAGGTLTTITYDGDLKRRKRAQGTSWTTYLWDGEQVLLELNKNDNTFVRYTLGRFDYGDLVSQRRSVATSFYHFDAIGTTRALTDASQTVTDSYIQRAFGTTRTTTGSTANYYRYIGKLGYYREATLPAYYVRRRYYSPDLGRFLSRDPVRGRGRTRYAYVRGRATRLVDPSGLQPGSTLTHCQGLAALIARLAALAGQDPAKCAALNEAIYDYIWACVAPRGDPGYPKDLWPERPWPHTGAPPWKWPPALVGLNLPDACHPPQPPGPPVGTTPVTPPVSGGGTVTAPRVRINPVNPGKFEYWRDECGGEHWGPLPPRQGPAQPPRSFIPPKPDEPPQPKPEDPMPGNEFYIQPFDPTGPEGIVKHFF